MPQRVPTTLEPAARPATTPGNCRLEIAARVETRTHCAGIGWRLWVAGVPRPPQGRTLRRAGTLMGAELAALRDALRAAAHERCARLQVMVPNPRLVAMLRSSPPAGPRRARASVERLRPLLETFPELEFASEGEVDSELAHAVAEALDAGLHAAAQREEHRAWAMERIVERARDVRLVRTDSGWVANERYHVQLDPMACECPAWKARWAGAPIGARRAARLPCKHLVALALHEGVTVPADLAALARRARA